MVTKFERVNLLEVLHARPSSQFGTWALSTTSNTEQLSHIDLLVTSLLLSGKANTKAEALKYLDEFTQYHKTGGHLMAADVKGNKYSSQFLKLRRELDRNNVTDTRQLFRLFGTLTHQFMWMLDAGLHPESHSFECTQNYLRAIQPDLFQQDRLFAEPQAAPRTLAELKKDTAYLRRLEAVWAEVQPIFKTNFDWETKLAKARLHIHAIKELLRPVLGTYLDKLNSIAVRDGVRSEYLAAVTLVIWIGVLIKALQSSSLFIFPEIPVIHPRHKLGYRRVDAIVVESIGGKKPSRSQAETLRKIATAISRGQFKVNSIAEFIRQLEQVFRERVSMHLVDYKSAVGDFTGLSDYVISSDSCPVPAHKVQMTMYSLLSTLDEYFLAGGDGTDDPWANSNAHINQAELSYLLPTEPPFKSTVVSGNLEQESSFLQEIVLRIPRAEQTGMLRGISNMLAGHALGLLKDGPQKGPPLLKVGSVTTLPFRKKELATPVDRLLESSRIYSDEYGIIELTRLGRSTQYLLYWDKLVEQIEQNTLATYQFTKEQGGYVECPDPEHPSNLNIFMYVDKKNGEFNCIHCQTQGVLDTVIFDSLAHVSVADVKRLSKHTKKVVLKPKIHQTLSNAQALFSEEVSQNSTVQSFFDSQGLSMATAVDLGLGYGASYMVEHLLEQNSFQDLIAAGLIDFSVRPAKHQCLFELLLQLGYEQAEITRPVNGAKVQFPEKYAKPYFTLAGSITFPLSVMGALVNFSGVSMQTGKTRRLSVKGGHNLVGLFNSRALRGQWSELCVAQHPLDALVLMQLGHTAVVAIEKATNKVALEEVVKSRKAIFTIAFPAGKRGAQATEKITTWIAEHATHQPAVRNFTNQHSADYPNFGKTPKTYSRWWKEEGKNL